jgi:hypothetical protein
VTLEARDSSASVSIEWLADEIPAVTAGSGIADVDPAAILLTCANCGAAMDERKCKLICTCGYFLSCSDYY